MLVVSRGMRNALRQARLYGYLVELNNMLYIPGGSHPVCSKSFALRMVDGGWLMKDGDRYQLTTKGREAPDD
ncbi:hypothetical protein CWO91_33000 [Bradyrhizobium genosp. SA-3]|uniref:hypothetical protein n=1 Tax=Bradyrhizobium genosp. SA-3 TaxID=508868 RepID=UPI00102931DD|nr:hypothetical protein [Bradyrhizobium genosp. SA-3]RZN01680.1 hypothetical protein CWO91_33000 [Bradyrhizobium genosp. SA-3]